MTSPAPRVALVSDSTSVRHRLHESLDVAVAVVPLQVVVDGVAYDECDVREEEDEAVDPAELAEQESSAVSQTRRQRRRRERARARATAPDLTGLTTVTASEVAQALRARQAVSTSRPSPERFVQTYERLAEEGHDQVVSIHLSGEVSGTYEAALVAARQVDVDVRAVDSRGVDMGTGFALHAAAEAIRHGATGDEVVRAACAQVERTRSLFYVDTLEYLRRGGRVGAAAAFVGSALAVKPLLQVDDGRIVPLEKVRTAGRALARLEELAVQQAGDTCVDVAVSHLDARERAEGLAERVESALPAVGRITVGEVGAVVGAHVGPGMVAVTVSRRD